MYFFGYGNFVSSAGDVGVTISKHFAVLAGYQLGSRLVVKGTIDRLGLRLVQKGAILGSAGFLLIDGVALDASALKWLSNGAPM